MDGSKGRSRLFSLGLLLLFAQSYHYVPLASGQQGKTIDGKPRLVRKQGPIYQGAWPAVSSVKIILRHDGWLTNDADGPPYCMRIKMGGSVTKFWSG